MNEKANEAIKHRIKTIKTLYIKFFIDDKHIPSKNGPEYMWPDCFSCEPMCLAHEDILQKTEEDIIQSANSYEQLVYAINEWETGDKDPLPQILGSMDDDEKSAFEQDIHIYKTLLLFQNRFMKEYDEYEKSLRRLVYAIDFTEVCEAMAGFANKIYIPSIGPIIDDGMFAKMDEIHRFRKNYVFYGGREDGVSYDRRPRIDIECEQFYSVSYRLKEYVSGLLTFLSERLLFFYIPLFLAEKMLDLITDREIRELLGDQYFTNAKPKYEFPSDYSRWRWCPDLKEGPNSPWNVKWNVITPFKDITTPLNVDRIMSGLKEYIDSPNTIDIELIKSWFNSDDSSSGGPDKIDKIEGDWGD